MATLVIRVDRLEMAGRRRTVGAVDKLSWLPCKGARYRCLSSGDKTYVIDVFRQKREYGLVRMLRVWEPRCVWQARWSRRR